MAELPDPFLGPDGKRVTTPRQWRRQRLELLRRVLHYEYGDLPPAPGNVIASASRSRHVKATGATEHKLRLKMGPGHAVATDLILTIPPGAGPFPAIVRGDLCWGRVKTAIAAAVVQRGYILAEFNRVQIADDSAKEDGVYLAYPGRRRPDRAWGFHRVVDYLHTLDVVDRTRGDGPLRGGKAALAGATDERIALTAPNTWLRRCRLPPPPGARVTSRRSPANFLLVPRALQQLSGRSRGPVRPAHGEALIASRALLGTGRWAISGQSAGLQQSHAAARLAHLGAAARIGTASARASRTQRRGLGRLLPTGVFRKNVFDRAAFPDAERGYSWRAPGRIGRMKGNGGR
jgi:hypothetical protein